MQFDGLTRKAPAESSDSVSEPAIVPPAGRQTCFEDNPKASRRADSLQVCDQEVGISPRNSEKRPSQTTGLAGLDGARLASVAGWRIHDVSAHVNFSRDPADT